jgi:hypothetical protein
VFGCRVSLPGLGSCEEETTETLFSLCRSSPVTFFPFFVSSSCARPAVARLYLFFSLFFLLFLLFFFSLFFFFFFFF